MKVESSFLRLFRQSRYAADDETQSPRQNRRELFAVAAVAFVAKHDRTFCLEFLYRVAGVPTSDLDHGFHLEPQKAFFADLAITDEITNKRYVVEFKVGARVMEKQHGARKTFDELGGYGRAFKDRFPGVTVYTVLSQQREFDDFTKGDVLRRARTWKELIPRGGKGGLLLEDLLDSLGELGISILRMRKIKHMKNAKHAGTTADIHDLLRFTLENFKKATLVVERDEMYEWAIGMYIRPRASEQRQLKKWLGQDWGYIGWIGYLLPKDAKQPQLSVWLSFAEKLASRRDKTIQTLRKRIHQGQVEPSQVYNDLIVKILASDVADEKRWFSETLELVLHHAKPHERNTKSGQRRSA